VKVLESAGLIKKTRDAQRRPCELKPEGLKDIAEWMDLYRAFWEESFDRLDEYLKQIAAEKNADKKSKGKKSDRSKE
jgi:hypothetical protein